MLTLSTRDFQLKMSKHLAKGEEILLTQYGKEVARVLPIVNKSASRTTKKVWDKKGIEKAIEPSVNIIPTKLDDPVDRYDSDYYFNPVPKRGKKK